MNSLHVAVKYYSLLKSREHVGSSVVAGVLDEASYSAARRELAEAGLLQYSDDAQRRVEMSLPSSGKAFFALDLDDLLQHPDRQLSAPAEFYLADIGYLSSSDAERPLEVDAYLDATQLVKSLIRIADHSVRKPKPCAIFLHGAKVELFLGFQRADLKPLPTLSSFVAEFVEADIHKEQKSTIIKTVLLEMLRGSELERLALPGLIRRFDEFVERVKASYQLYVSEFSFEKIKQQVEQERLEHSFKLNKVFSDIQNQLLAIPVALILVGGQMKSDGEVTAANVSILLGSLVFGLLISLLIRNQRNSLESIKLGIDSQWKALEGKHVLVRAKLGEHYRHLDTRYRTQRRYLRLIDAIVALAILATAAYFAVNSGLIDHA